MGFIDFVSSLRDTASQYGKGRNAWGILPITTHWIAGQSEHTSLLRKICFVKIDGFQKGGAERSNYNVQYVEIMCFFFLL